MYDKFKKKEKKKKNAISGFLFEFIKKIYICSTYYVLNMYIFFI